MTKQIRFSAFAMNCIVHQLPGLWRHPRDQSLNYKRLSYWIELANILERGNFDGLFARRMTTLDHLTEGRIGWNIVTGYLDSAARGSGRANQTPHDARYDMADEYMDVVYKLWETSWDDDAVAANCATGLYADPAKVQEINHEGEHFHLQAIYLCEPSPQRTPVLYQAGNLAARPPKGGSGINIFRFAQCHIFRTCLCRG